MSIKLVRTSLLAAILLAGCATNPLGQKQTGDKPMAERTKSVPTQVLAPKGQATTRQILNVPAEDCMIDYAFFLVGNAACAVNTVACGTGDKFRLASGTAPTFGLGELDFFEPVALSEIALVQYLSDTTSQPQLGATRLTFALELEGDGYDPVTDPELEFLSSHAGTGSEAFGEGVCGTVSTTQITAFSFNTNLDGFTGTFAQAQAAYPNAQVIAIGVITDSPATAPFTELYIDDLTVTFNDPAIDPIVIDGCEDVSPLE